MSTPIVMQHCGMSELIIPAHPCPRPCHHSDPASQPHHVCAVLEAEEHAPGPPVHVVVVDGSPADGRRVHDRRDLAEVVDQQLIEQRLIPVLCSGESGSVSSSAMHIAAVIMLTHVQTHLELRKDAPLAHMVSCHRRILQINPVLAEKVVICTA